MFGVVGFGRTFDVHERHRTRHRALARLLLGAPRQQFDTLHAAIPFEMFSYAVFSYVIGQISYPQMSSLSDHFALNTTLRNFCFLAHRHYFTKKQHSRFNFMVVALERGGNFTLHHFTS
jgi:hypothetical protein